MMGLFFSQSDSLDSEYRVLADSEWTPAVEARLFIESQWLRVAPFVDTNLPGKAARRFRAHFWELYLAAAFVEHGPPLVPRKKRGSGDAGPDLLLEDGTGVEAVLATAGTGPDAVPDPQLGQAAWVPDDAIRLRLLNALDEKRRKAERYLAAGIRRPDKAFVVAINGSAVPSSRFEQDLPRIVRALFPFGPFQVHINVESYEVAGTSYAFQNSVTKQSGSQVATDGFLNADKLSGISAVLYSCVDPLNRPTTVGGDFVLVHNPFAKVPVSAGRLPVVREYMMEGNGVRWTSGLLAQ